MPVSTNYAEWILLSVNNKICFNKCEYLFVNFMSDGYCDKYNYRLLSFGDKNYFRCNKCIKNEVK